MYCRRVIDLYLHLDHPLDTHPAAESYLTVAELLSRARAMSSMTAFPSWGEMDSAALLQSHPGSVSQATV